MADLPYAVLVCAESYGRRAGAAGTARFLTYGKLRKIDLAVMPHLVTRKPSIGEHMDAGTPAEHMDAGMPAEHLDAGTARKKRSRA